MNAPIAQDLPLTGIDVYALPPAEGEAVLRRQLAAAYRLVDYFGWTELIYGHLVMARACLAEVLAEKVERDFLSKAAALDVARLMLRDAPLALYGLADGKESP